MYFHLIKKILNVKCQNILFTLCLGPVKQLLPISLRTYCNIWRLSTQIFFSVAKFQNEFQKIPVYGLHEWFFFINGAVNYDTKYSDIDRAAWNMFLDQLCLYFYLKSQIELCCCLRSSKITFYLCFAWGERHLLVLYLRGNSSSLVHNFQHRKSITLVVIWLIIDFHIHNICICR